MTIVQGLDFLVEQFLPAFFDVFGGWMITDDVSVLGFSVGVTILCVLIGTIVLRV